METNSSEFFRKYSIGEIYIGQWSKGLRNGSGKLWREGGFWFTGQFSYDTIHGTGAMYRTRSSGVEKGVFSKEAFKGTFDGF